MTDHDNDNYIYSMMHKEKLEGACDTQLASRGTALNIGEYVGNLNEPKQIYLEFCAM